MLAARSQIKKRIQQIKVKLKAEIQFPCACNLKPGTCNMEQHNNNN